MVGSVVYQRIATGSTGTRRASSASAAPFANVMIHARCVLSWLLLLYLRHLWLLHLNLRLLLLLRHLRLCLCARALRVVGIIVQILRATGRAGAGIVATAASTAVRADIMLNGYGRSCVVESGCGSSLIVALLAVVGTGGHQH